MTANVRARSVLGVLVLVAVLVVSGCGAPGAAEEPRPETGPSAGTPAATPGPGENTASSDPSASAPPTPASTPVPPPSPGTVEETVPSRATKTQRPVDLDQRGRFSDEVTVEVTDLQQLDDPEAGMPNEVPGPALAVTITVTNHSAEPVPLDAVVVEVLDANRTPGNRMTGEPYEPLGGSLPVGESASGTYVHTVDLDLRDPVTILVTLTAADPVVAFQGPVR